MASKIVLVQHVFLRQYITMITSKHSSCRNNKMVADAVLEKEYVISIDLVENMMLIYPRKDKQVNQVFGQAFSWSEAIDAAADVYNGVS